MTLSLTRRAHNALLNKKKSEITFEFWNIFSWKKRNFPELMLRLHWNLLWHILKILRALCDGKFGSFCVRKTPTTFSTDTYFPRAMQSFPHLLLPRKSHFHRLLQYLLYYVDNRANPPIRKCLYDFSISLLSNCILQQNFDD